MSQVLDYSFSRPSLQGIKDKGFIGIIRYLSYTNEKNLSGSELKYAQAIGLSVGVVWETTANRVRTGSEAGRSDAMEALRQSKVLGISDIQPIYFACDYDTPEVDQPAINGYYQACAEVIGKGRLGAYGGYWVIKRLLDAGIVTYGWQTLAWSGGNRDPRIHLYQNGGQILDSDINDVIKDNWNGGVGDNVSTVTDKKIADMWAEGYLGRVADPEFYNSVVGQPVEIAEPTTFNSGEAQNHLTWVKSIPKQLDGLQKDNTALARRLQESSDLVASLTAKLEAKPEPHQLPPATEDTTPAEEPQHTGQGNLESPNSPKGLVGFLNGKRTYIVAVAVVVFNYFNSTQHFDPDTVNLVNGLLAAAGLTTLRLAIKKTEWLD